MHQIRISYRDGEYRLALAELPHHQAEKSAYYTDDLDDAVLTAASMRRGWNKLTA